MWFCEECCEPNRLADISCVYCGEPGQLADSAAEWVLLKVTPIDVDAILEFLMAGCDPFDWFNLEWLSEVFEDEDEENPWTD